MRSKTIPAAVGLALAIWSFVAPVHIAAAQNGQQVGVNVTGGPAQATPAPTVEPPDGGTGTGNGTKVGGTTAERGSGGGVLPRTGTGLAPIVAVGLACLVLGTALARRRRTTAPALSARVSE